MSISVLSLAIYFPLIIVVIAQVIICGLSQAGTHRTGYG